MKTLIRGSIAPRAMSRSEFLTPFDRLFDDMLEGMFPMVSKDLGVDFFLKGSYPKVNVIDNGPSILIEAAIPGMKKEDVTIEVSDGVLTIKGDKNQSSSIDDSQYIKREIKKSSFRRSFRLSEALDLSSITARYDHGMLTLSIDRVKPDHKETVIKTIEID